MGDFLILCDISNIIKMRSLITIKGLMLLEKRRD